MPQDQGQTHTSLLNLVSEVCIKTLSKSVLYTSLCSVLGSLPKLEGNLVQKPICWYYKIPSMLHSEVNKSLSVCEKKYKMVLNLINSKCYLLEIFKGKCLCHILAGHSMLPLSNQHWAMVPVTID